VLSETEEGKVSEEWVGKRQFLALRFCHGRLNGSAFNNLAGALHTDRVGCTLSVGREVKMEIPDEDFFSAIALELECPVKMRTCSQWDSSPSSL
jgi:hypothetical protein